MFLLGFLFVGRLVGVRKLIEKWVDVVFISFEWQWFFLEWNIHNDQLIISDIADTVKNLQLRQNYDSGAGGWLYWVKFKTDTGEIIEYNVCTGEKIDGIQGKADIQDVVLAVSNAEMALNTVVSVRDTAIKAYNSIISMPI